MLIVAHDKSHNWKPTRLIFAGNWRPDDDERQSHPAAQPGAAHGSFRRAHRLLSRSSYVGCLLNEADRARTQGTPLSLAVCRLIAAPTCCGSREKRRWRNSGAAFAFAAADRAAERYGGKIYVVALAFILPARIFPARRTWWIN